MSKTIEGVYKIEGLGSLNYKATFYPPEPDVGITDWYMEDFDSIVNAANQDIDLESLCENFGPDAYNYFYSKLGQHAYEAFNEENAINNFGHLDF